MSEPKPQIVPPQEKMATVHFDVDARKKSSWVRASQRAESKLIPWIIEQLDKAANKERP